MLGWSPVLRSLMRRKRKYDMRIDEVEDGARAQIVEEAVVKIIHSEGVRLARLRRASDMGPLLASADEISFSFLRLIRNMVAGLEAEGNRDWEWEDAIMEGHRLFDALRIAGEGKIIVNLTTRSLTFEQTPAMETYV
jgi:hypothetical protein